jgi:hypothetical protein
MVKVGRRQHHPGCANCHIVANSSGKPESASITPGPFVFVPPSTIA